MSDKKKKSKKEDNTIRLDKFTKQHYKRYGVAVNEDRAIPSPIDGLKPVARRALWSAFKLGARSNSKIVKSARVVGDMIGLYHPHGDMGSYKAIVTMVNGNSPLFEGVGNWGRFSDKSFAAHRYTNTRMAKYADKIFFDSFYLPCIEYVPNFDGSTVEPITLPALFPNLLATGTSGIGVGLATEIPAFTIPSIVKCLENIFENKKVDVKFLEKLVFTHAEGAVVNIKTQKAEFRKLLETGKGRIIYNSVYTVNEKTNEVTVTGFAFSSMEAIIKKLETKFKTDLLKILDISGTKSRQGTLLIQLKKALKGEALKSSIEKLGDVLSSAQTFNIKVTERKISEFGDEVDVSLADYSVADIFEKWYKYRIDLEKRACGFAIEKCEKQIADLELKIKAVEHLDDIVQCLKSKMNDKEMSEHLAKKMSVSVEDAFKVICFEVRRLKTLEKSEMLERIKEINKEIKAFNVRIKKPDEYILTTLKGFEKL